MTNIKETAAFVSFCAGIGVALIVIFGQGLCYRAAAEIGYGLTIIGLISGAWARHSKRRYLAWIGFALCLLSLLFGSPCSF